MKRSCFWSLKALHTVERERISFTWNKHTHVIHITGSGSRGFYCAAGRGWYLFSELQAAGHGFERFNDLSFGCWRVFQSLQPDSLQQLQQVRHQIHLKSLTPENIRSQWIIIIIIIIILRFQGLSLVLDWNASLSCFNWNKLALTDLKIYQCLCFVSRCTAVMYFYKNIYKNHLNVLIDLWPNPDLV